MNELQQMECHVKDAIIAKLQKEIEILKAQRKELATWIKIPRLHDQYIREHGAEDLLARCKDLLDRQDRADWERE